MVIVLWGHLEGKLEDRGFFGHFWESMGTQTAGEVFRSWHALRGPSGHSGSGRGDRLCDCLGGAAVKVLYLHSIYFCKMHATYETICCKRIG